MDSRRLLIFFPIVVSNACQVNPIPIKPDLSIGYWVFSTQYSVFKFQ